jgi:YD repeat-containing protein
VGDKALNPLGMVLSYDSVTNQYDQNDELVKTTDGVGNATSFTYDAAGNKTSETDGSGSSVAATTQLVYNLAGQLIRVIDPDNNTTQFTYDGAGDRLTMTDPSNHVVSSQFDLAGRVTATTDRDGRKRTFAYDGGGNLLTETWYASDGVSRPCVSPRNSEARLLALVPRHAAAHNRHRKP